MLLLMVSRARAALVSFVEARQLSCCKTSEQENTHPNCLHLGAPALMAKASLFDSLPGFKREVSPLCMYMYICICTYYMTINSICRYMHIYIYIL